MAITLFNISYIHSDTRWKNKSIEDQVLSYYSDIRDILQATVPLVNPTIQLELTHKLAVMQTKAVFKIPGYPTDANITINNKGEFIE